MQNTAVRKSELGRVVSTTLGIFLAAAFFLVLSAFRVLMPDVVVQETRGLATEEMFIPSSLDYFSGSSAQLAFEDFTIPEAMSMYPMEGVAPYGEIEVPSPVIEQGNVEEGFISFSRLLGTAIWGFNSLFNTQQE